MIHLLSVSESENRVYEPSERPGDDHLSFPPRGVPYVRFVFRHRERSEAGYLGNRRVLRSTCVQKVLSRNDTHGVADYEEQNPLSAVLLCAHLYYRALQTVPTLVRLWILECKDRNLSAAVTTYTSKYFSSALIDAELERVMATRLDDGKMNVKVIPVHREVNATYTIDESEIKMNLKIPPDWPLHVIEVRGGKKVGVKEDRWKSWISGVRQVVLTQVGLTFEPVGDSISHISHRATSWTG
jgi:hypothetical protein